ncbi:hypothetical protein [Rahnella sp. PAMC 25559]|uniref:hypothetical protein n=1 Tax=Rahnella sp. PAMC 25559 TaxID=3423225 RepID=UPI003D668777
MKIIKNMKFMSALTLIAVGLATTAQASPISTIVTGTGNVIFQEVGSAQISITPATGLSAGKVPANTQIATASAVATFPTAVGTSVAYRWTPSASTIINADNLQRSISGRNNAANKLEVVSIAAGAVQDAISPEWYVLAPVTGTTAVTMSINVTTTAKEQVVAADTYVLSMDAAVWSA